VPAQSVTSPDDVTPDDGADPASPRPVSAEPAVLSAVQAGVEFSRQVQAYVGAGHPELAHLAEEAFRELLEPLRAEAVARATGQPLPTRARVPFVIVLSPALVPVSAAAERLTHGGHSGFVSADTADIDEFRPTAEVAVPGGTAYLVLDVDRGGATLNCSPDEAVARFAGEGRSPLTVQEGVAFLTVHPESLEKNNCFQTAGSRKNDRRVPGLWISQKRPKLGYCWAGNRHTWLGAASCADRVAAR